MELLKIMQLVDIPKLLISILLLSPTMVFADKNKDCQQALDNSARLEITKHCPAVFKKGDSEMAYRIGESFDFLDQLPDHSLNALKWYTLAAESGHPLAQRNLAALYDGGFGIPRDPFRAFHWYHEAAQQGQPHSQLMTGMMYLYGTGTAQDAERAKQWFKQAAQSGEANGQYMLGKISYASDPSGAIAWFQKSAAQNNRYALYQLGLLHYRGEHLLASDQQAIDYAERSLVAGHDKARVLKERLLARMQPEQTTTAAAKQQPLTKKSTQPTPAHSSQRHASANPALTAAEDDSQWLLQQPDSNFTIQLALMSQYDSIKRFARLYPQVKGTRYYLSSFNNGNRYILVKGSYSDITDAKAAMAVLPEPVKKMKPWVRPFSTLQEQYVKPD